jgi:alpha-L-fucosidase
MHRIIDGDPHTVWYTSNKGPVPVIDLGAEHTLQGFTYLPRQDGRRGGVINRFRLSLSRDGQQWKEVIGNGSFANILNHPVAQRIRFDREQPARYLRFQPVDDVEHAGSYGIAELGILTK